ncbi:MAG: extracellular solute-binding protein [Caldilineaceae bacterium]
MGGALLTACFGSSDDDEPAEVAPAVAMPDETPTAAATSTPTPNAAASTRDSAAGAGAIAHVPPPAADEVALTIWVDAALAPVVQELGSAFELEYGLKIAVVPKELAQIRSGLAEAAQNGEGPDILFDSYFDIAQMVENGLLHELTLDNRAAEFDLNVLRAFSLGGKLYGLPYTAESVALIYNSTLIAEPPITWRGVQEAAAALQANGAAEYGLVLQSNDPIQFHPILTAFGGFLFGADADGNVDVENVGIDSVGALAAGAWLDDMHQAGLLLSAADGDEMYSAFKDGAAAMMIGDAGLVGRLRTEGAPFAVAALPGEVAESQPLMAARGFLISAFSRDPELAQTFLTEFIATPETMQALFAADQRPSAYLPVLDAMQDGALAAFRPDAENIQLAPALPVFAQAWAIWADALSGVISGDDAAQAAFAQAAAQIRTAVAAR